MAFQCTLPAATFTQEDAELIETRWFSREQASRIDRDNWIDNVLNDAAR